jgi:ubiquinol-cytochrome c reductase cytochrome b subunit
MHANGASMFFIFIYLHLARGIFYTSYFSPRKSLWYSGLIIFILTMATAFMGYVLPWGQMSFWGATVITNLFSAIPYIGPTITSWIWGGFSIDNAILVRFFSLHYILPFLIVAVVIVHLYCLHINGSNSPFGLISPDKISFLPYFYIKDLFAFLIALVIFFILVFFYPNMLGHPDNYIPANAIITPTHIVPEWYFIPFYAILRSVPNKLGGVICMGLSILIIIVPSWYSSLFYSKRILVNFGTNVYFCIFFWIFIANVILLGWLGAQPIVYPFSSFSIYATIFYFSFLTIGIRSLLYFNCPTFDIDSKKK